MAVATVIGIILALAFSPTAKAQGGSLEVHLSENDYRSREDSGELPTAVIVTGTQSGGVVQFRLHAITTGEYAASGNNLCHNELTLPTSGIIKSADPATDLLSTDEVCSRRDSETQIDCPFSIAQDDILETDEILVIVLSVVDDGGNSVTVGDNCAVATIFPGTSQGMLQVIGPEFGVLTEGESSSITLRKNFNATFPITLDISFSGQGGFGPPILGGDYIFNTSVILTPSTTFLNLPLEIVNDSYVEDLEVFTITFSGRTEVPGVDILTMPASVTISITDDDVVRSGFTVESLTLTEGQGSDVCVELNGINSIDLQRSVELLLETTSTDLSLNPPAPSTVYLEARSPECFRVFAQQNMLLEGPKTVELSLTDQILARLTEPSEISRHRQLNIVEPRILTLTIEDDDGTPNQPDITKLVVDDKGSLSFEWTIDEENGLRPIQCFFGNVTERPHLMDQSEKGNPSTEVGGAEESVHPFNFCGSSEPEPKRLHYQFEDFDSAKEYIVTVCSRNAFGVNCSIPNTRIPAPEPVPLMPANTGIIVGIVVAVLVLALCCLILTIFLICCIIREREKRYFPQKREKQFRREAENSHWRYSTDSASYDFEEEFITDTNSPLS